MAIQLNLQTQNFPESSMDLSSITSVSQGGFFVSTVMPHKLDADHFSAEDLDGVTETLFGTGNMNFLMMQDAQTNGAAASSSDAPSTPSWDNPLAAIAGGTLFSPIAPSSQNFANLLNNDGDFGFDSRNFQHGQNLSNPSLNTDLSTQADGTRNSFDFGNNNNNTLHNWGVGNTTSNGTNGTNGSSGIDGLGISGSDGISGSNGSHGNNGTNGNNGNNGTDGPGGGDTIVNVINENITNVTEIINVTITEIINIIPPILDSGSDDTDINIGGGGINIGDIEIPLNPILPIEVIIDPIEDLIGDLDIAITPNIDLFGDSETRNDHGDSDITTTLDVDLLDSNLLDLNLDIPLDPLEALLGDIDLDITGSLNLLGDVASPLFDDFAGGSVGTITATVGDAVQDLVGSLIGTGPTHEGDTDLAINLPVGDAALNLDLVENLVGDVDLGVTPNLDLFGDGETSNAAGDTDVNINLGVGVLDTTLINVPPIDLPLDVVEAILGDIDLDVTLATNLLGGTAADLLDNVPGGSIVADTVSETVHEVLDIVLEPLTPHLQDTLEVVNNVTEPLLTDAVTDVNNLLSDTNDSVMDIVSGDLSGVEDLVSGAAENTTELVENLVTNLGDVVTEQDVIGDVTQIVENVLTGDVVGDILENLVTEPTGIVEGLLGNITQSLDPQDTLGTVTDALGTGGEDVLSTVTDLLSGDTSGVEDALSNVTDVLENLTNASDVTDTITNLLGGDVSGTDDVVSTVTDTISELLTNPTDVLDNIVNLDLLSGITNNLSNDNSPSSSASSLWPENNSSSGSNPVFDTISNTIDILPDPIGNVVEGLGVLDLVGGGGSSSGNSGGGLLGGLGGLFG